MIAIETLPEGRGWRIVRFVAGKGYTPVPNTRTSQNFRTIDRDARKLAGDQEPLMLPFGTPIVEAPREIPEINIVEAMKHVGIRALVAEEAEDIDYWPPFALLFPSECPPTPFTKENPCTPATK